MRFTLLLLTFVASTASATTIPYPPTSATFAANCSVDLAVHINGSPGGETMTIQALDEQYNLLEWCEVDVPVPAGQSVYTVNYDQATCRGAEVDYIYVLIGTEYQYIFVDGQRQCSATNSVSACYDGTTDTLKITVTSGSNPDGITTLEYRHQGVTPWQTQAIYQAPNTVVTYDVSMSATGQTWSVGQTMEVRLWPTGYGSYDEFSIVVSDCTSGPGGSGDPSISNVGAAWDSTACGIVISFDLDSGDLTFPTAVAVTVHFLDGQMNETCVGTAGLAPQAGTVAFSELVDVFASTVCGCDWRSIQYVNVVVDVTAVGVSAPVTGSAAAGCDCPEGSAAVSACINTGAVQVSIAPASSQVNGWKVDNSTTAGTDNSHWNDSPVAAVSEVLTTLSASVGDTIVVTWKDDQDVEHTAIILVAECGADSCGCISGALNQAFDGYQTWRQHMEDSWTTGFTEQLQEDRDGDGAPDIGDADPLDPQDSTGQYDMGPDWPGKKYPVPFFWDELKGIMPAQLFPIPDLVARNHVFILSFQGVQNVWSSFPWSTYEIETFPTQASYTQTLLDMIHAARVILQYWWSFLITFVLAKNVYKVFRQW